MKRPYKQGPYTKGEVALLKKGYPATSAVELAGRMKRSLVSVQKQLREMGIGRRKDTNWTPQQSRVLRRMFGTEAMWEIANRLGKTPSQVKRKAATLRLRK